MLQFMGVTRVGQELVTDQQQLLKCPPSNTIISGIRVSTYEQGWVTNIQSMADGKPSSAEVSAERLGGLL